MSFAYASMCQFGMQSHVDTRLGPRGAVAKATGFRPSSWAVCTELGRRCDDDQKHVALVGGRAAGAKVYLLFFCAAMCRAIAKQEGGDAGGVTGDGKMDRKQVRS